MTDVVVFMLPREDSANGPSSPQEANCLISLHNVVYPPDGVLLRLLPHPGQSSLHYYKGNEVGVATSSSRRSVRGERFGRRTIEYIICLFIVARAYQSQIISVAFWSFRLAARLVLDVRMW
ncbi:hypothetical protein RRF57_012639 [Xylaria bambusicola]|uniref:Uncharacterized protein n=1 Tax=Xylaria bambusicola TaxID=326684 RepID=A0AAN7UVI7_9PEZI